MLFKKTYTLSLSLKWFEDKEKLPEYKVVISVDIYKIFFGVSITIKSLVKSFSYRNSPGTIYTEILSDSNLQNLLGNFGNVRIDGPSYDQYYVKKSDLIEFKKQLYVS